MKTWIFRVFWFRLLVGGVSLVLVMAVTARDQVATDDSTEGPSLANAMVSRRAAVAAGEMYAVIKRAQARRPGGGATLLRRELPPLATTVEVELRSAGARVASTRVTSAAGTACRRAAVDFMDRRRWLFATVGSDVEGAVDPWAAIGRFAVGATTLERWWHRQVRRCAKDADPDDRAGLVRGLGAF